MRLLALSLLLATSLSLVPALADAPPWAEILAQVDLTPDTAQLDAGRWRGGGQYSLSQFDRLWDDWRLIEMATGDAGRLGGPGAFGLVHRGGWLLGLGDLRPTLAYVPPRYMAPQAVLCTAIANIHASCGQPLSPDEMEELRRRTRPVSDAIAEVAARALLAVPDAVAARDCALEGFGGEDRRALAFDKALQFGVDGAVDDDVLRLIETFGMGGMVAGAADLADGLGGVRGLPGWVQYDVAPFSWETPLGAVVIGGLADDTHGPAPPLLLLDTGGNDRYTFDPLPQNASRPVSIVIDLEGDDTYAAADRGLAASVLGFGFIEDLAGNDTYECGEVGLGAGVFGVGILLDDAGDDIYTCRRFGQGAGAFGIGALNDGGGDDTYRCFQMAQGYGYVRGYGVLFDHGGSDHYEANDTQIDYPSPQTAEHNTSLAQGCGFGRRAHPGDGHSMAGGMGVLASLGGDDTYRCGVFGQGVSYWYAQGYLFDGGGNDSYDGVWYIQGATAHYAVAGFCDTGGDDRYLGRMTMAQSAAHDFSLSWFHDVEGNDRYECPSNSKGLGIYNGVGVFVEGSGDDEYIGGASLGASSNATRPESLTLGLFYDAAGTDRYPDGDLARNGSKWARPLMDGLPQARGAGMDR